MAGLSCRRKWCAKVEIRYQRVTPVVRGNSCILPFCLSNFRIFAGSILNVIWSVVFVPRRRRDMPTCCSDDTCPAEPLMPSPVGAASGSGGPKIHSFIHHLFDNATDQTCAPSRSSHIYPFFIAVCVLCSASLPTNRVDDIRLSIMMPRSGSRYRFCFNTMLLATLSKSIRIEGFIQPYSIVQKKRTHVLQSTIATVSTSNGAAAEDDELNANFDPEHITRDPNAEASNHDRMSNNPSTDKSQPHENAIDLNKYRSIEDFNEELGNLAKRCSDGKPGRREDVIGLAALVEGKLHRLQHLIRDSGQSEKIIQPNLMTMNTVLSAWANAAQALAENRGRGTMETTLETNMMEINVYTPSDAAMRALSILSGMERDYLSAKSDISPSTASYNIVLEALAKCRGKGMTQKVEALVERMLHLSKGGEDGKEGVVNGSADLWDGPDIASYNCLLESLAYSDEGMGVKKSKEILDTLERQYNDTEDERLKPNIRTVNQVINVYSKHSARITQSSKRGGFFITKEEKEEAWKYAEAARELLHMIKNRYEQTGDNDYKPDVATYTAVCDAYAKVGTVESAEMADELLKEMEKSRYVRPNVKTFTAVISAWSKAPHTQSAMKAEEIVQRMERIYQKQRKSGKTIRQFNSVKPNTRTYTSVINAWARSSDPLKPERALKILKKMLDMSKDGDMSVKPNIFTYNAVIDVCARCQGTAEQQTKALKIAFAVNKAIIADEKVSTSPATFASLIRCAEHLIPAGDQRNAICSAVFKSAKTNGKANQSVLRALLTASDRHVYDGLAAETLDEKGRVCRDKIPDDWCKHSN